ncbi:MAG TPA: hypothetical protein VLF61_00260 [Rhabdochlamydiaceae bacterium]|nr:hypothetical protein [Rhabdochlamydiaceae bacterium]
MKIYNFFSWIQFLLDRPFRLQKVCDALYQGNHYFKRHSQWLIHQRFDIVFTLKKEKLPGLENTNIKQVLCSSSEDLMKSVTNALEVGKRIFVDCPSAESYLEALKTLINKEVERLEALAQTLD